MLHHILRRRNSSGIRWREEGELPADGVPEGIDGVLSGLHNSALSLETAFSIGLKSGL